MLYRIVAVKTVLTVDILGRISQKNSRIVLSFTDANEMLECTDTLAKKGYFVTMEAFNV